MKVLVNEIEKYDLMRVMPYFLKDNEIIILEDEGDSYYIEENIIDLDSIIKKCEQEDYDKSIDWGDFCLFWALMYSIYKQRDIGRKVSDLEYLYLKYKEKYDLSYTTTFKLNMEFEHDEEVIVGKSEIGTMYLYKWDIYFEFIFYVEYMKKNVFGKLIKKTTHWHPSNFFEAGKQLDMFMSGVDFMGIK